MANTLMSTSIQSALHGVLAMAAIQFELNGVLAMAAQKRKHMGRISWGSTLRSFQLSLRSRSHEPRRE